MRELEEKGPCYKSAEKARRDVQALHELKNAWTQNADGHEYVNARTMVFRIIISTGKPTNALTHKKTVLKDLKIQRRDSNDNVAYEVN